MAAALLISMFDTSFLKGESSSGIVLPGEDSVEVGVDLDSYSGNLEMLEAVKIDKSNIKRLIEAMRRPDQYHISAGSTIYHSSGQSTTVTEGYVSGEISKSVTLDQSGAPKEHCILTDDKVYIWAEGSNTWYEGSRGGFGVDNGLIIPTYEKILDLDEADITDADFSLYNEIYCVFVETSDPNSGYRSLYYISVDDGLLVGAQSFDGDMLVYSLSVSVLDMPQDMNNVFRLPDGTVIKSE